MQQSPASSTFGSAVTSPAVTSFADVSFVIAIESGGLEEQTVRLVDSLRRFGGGAAGCDVFCVCPRFGPGLTSRTKAALRRLNAQLIQTRPKLKYPWYHYLNKWLAADEAERRAKTPVLVFLDCDILILREPTAFLLPAGVDFGGVQEVYSQPDHRAIEADKGFWDKLASTVGLTLGDVPILPTTLGRDARMYWNGGVAAFRRGKGFPGRVIADVTHALDEHIASNTDKLHFIEQRMVGMSVIKGGLNWRELPVSHNTNIAGWERMAPPADVLRETCVLHYHSAMDANAWEWMLSLLKETHPDVQQWLSSSYGPLAERRPRYAKAISYVLRGLRSRARDRHIRGCTVYGDPLPT